MTAAIMALAGCAAPGFPVGDLPAAVTHPPGHVINMHAHASGTNRYACRANGGGFAWTLIATEARLTNPHGKPSGRHYASPATFESLDGSMVTGIVQAEAPATIGALPLQLLRANPATGLGALRGVSFIQRVNTRGGLPPTDPCHIGAKDQMATVAFRAGFVFYKPR